MRIFERLAALVIISAGLPGASAQVALFAQEPQEHASAQRDKIAHDRIAHDRIGIERLHQQDVEATLSDKADDLAKLWDNEAVRLEQGDQAEVGKAVIYADDKRWQAKSAGSHTLYYKPEIKDLQMAGDWAFEWGYFDTAYKESANAKPVTLRGKQLRILKRQPDGSGKFARVMTLIDSRN